MFVCKSVFFNVNCYDVKVFLILEVKGFWDFGLEENILSKYVLWLDW